MNIDDALKLVNGLLILASNAAATSERIVSVINNARREGRDISDEELLTIREANIEGLAEIKKIIS